MTIRNILYHPVSGKTNNLLLFAVALVPAFVLFTFPLSVFSNGIDPPLAWVFNFLVQGNLVLGKHIIFPHGPLAFLMYPLPVGINLWIAISVHLAARTFLAYCLLKLATRKPILYLVIALVSSFILLAINDLLLTLIQIIVLCYLNFFERRNISWLFPALILTPLALFIKAFVGIVSLLITVSFAGIMVYRTVIGTESRYRLLLFLTVPFIILMVWFGLYGDLHVVFAYLKGMSELAGDNSAAVAVYPLNNWWWTGTGIACGLILLIINLKNEILARYTILVGPALFAIWKYGMAREDYLHTSMLFAFILFVLLIFNLVAGKVRIINISLSAVIVLFFYFTLQKSFYFEDFKINANGLQTLASRAYHDQYFSDTCNWSSEKSISRNKLDQPILVLIGDKTADVYPWDYSYLAANNLNWQPRPVLQSYASYTRELDQLNASHFGSEKSPEFIIWELRKITHDIHGGSLESIDGRYLLNDEPDALISLFSHYERAAFQQGVFPAVVLKKRNSPLKPDTKVIGSETATWNTWIDVPQNSPGIMRASVNIDRNLSGRIMSFFYKDEATYVYYLLDNSDIRMYRIVPKNVAYGLWMNPLLINPELGLKEPAVRKIMFRCSNTALMKGKIDIKWEQVLFSQTTTEKGISGENANTVYSFFGITADASAEQLFVSENNLETKPAWWSLPDEKRILAIGGNRSSQILPGEYSVSFEYPLDSLSWDHAAGGLIVRTGLWAKAVPAAKAIYVISIEKNGKSLLWKAVDLQPFIHDQHAMNFITNFAVADKVLLSQPGLILKVYAWNTGEKSILLDDFSVRIETR